jgi:tetratricopeptide (TPR) repeat protein
MIRTAVTFVLLSSAVALAQPSDPKVAAQAAFDAGLKLYEAKQYTEAINKFALAYQLDHDPIYLYNEAQAYRLSGDCKNAVVFYEQFRTEAKNDLSPADLEKVNHYIAGEQCTPKDQTTPPNPNPPNPNPPNPNPIQPNPNPAQPTDTPHHSNTLVYGLGAVGAIGLVVGVIFTSKTLGYASDKDEVFKTCNGSEMTSPACTGPDGSEFQKLAKANQNGPTAEDVEIVAYAVAGVAFAGAAYLYLTHRDHTPEKMVLVAPTPGGAAVTAAWRF